ncbi:MAG TPA: phage tail assembly protein [Sphingopyxis sp.]|nr:phage tail assembly protein [Sphingopyxis sp.]
MTDQTEAPARDSRKFKTITLDDPIKRGDTEITAITLRKPQAGELRGLTLEDLLKTDVDTILKLIPRISDPALIDQEVAVMDPADLTECGGAIRGFFMTKAQQAIMDRMIEEQSSKT